MSLIVTDAFNQFKSRLELSQSALSNVEEIVSKHGVYEKLGVETDNPTITFEYEDNTKVELVPAYLDNVGYAPDGTLTSPSGRGYWIPKNNRWVMADCDYDAEYITSANKNSDGYQYLIYMFFWLCKDEFLKSIKISGSKSPYADGYMTSLKKQELSNLFGKIAEYCKNIVNDIDAVEAWHKLFGPPFPTAA